MGEFIRKSIDEWDGKKIRPGQAVDVKLAVGESYSSMTVKIPIHIRRAKKAGPVVFVTAALHGDEINGTGAIQRIITENEFELQTGALMLVPVLNILGFDRHSRYLPDRRDLNRTFPGSATGSLASRLARKIFDEIVSRCDYGIDLHTAAVRRTNYPNTRADISDPEIKRIAMAFGTDIIINNRGPKGSFRREACQVGCTTVVMEGGEVWKVEPGIVETAVRGIKNVLSELGMIEHQREEPPTQIVIEKSKWIRAQLGGFLQFHVKPGDMVEKDQPLATNTTILGRDRNTLAAPYDAVVIGMTTLPAISPGEPICHLGKLPKGCNPRKLGRLRSRAEGLEERVADELASNVLVVEPSAESE